MVPLEELKVEELVNVEYSSLVNLLKLFKDITYNNDSHTIDVSVIVKVTLVYLQITYNSDIDRPFLYPLVTLVLLDIYNCGTQNLC